MALVQPAVEGNLLRGGWRRGEVEREHPPSTSSAKRGVPEGLVEEDDVTRIGFEGIRRNLVARHPKWILRRVGAMAAEELERAVVGLAVRPGDDPQAAGILPNRIEV